MRRFLRLLGDVCRVPARIRHIEAMLEAMLTPEQRREVQDAASFGVTVPGLRRQRASYGQFTSGPYAGCTPADARHFERLVDIGAWQRSLRTDAEWAKRWQDEAVPLGVS